MTEKREIILGWDSCLSNSAALLIDGEIRANNDSVDKRPSALMETIDELLKSNNVEVDDLSALALNRGPGSFTGVRVGIAMAKGLSGVSDLPVIPVNSFECISELEPDVDANAVILNAGGGYFYFSEKFHAANGDTGRLLKRDELFAKLEVLDTVIFYGKKAETFKEEVLKYTSDIEIHVSEGSLAKSVCALADRKFRAGDFITSAELKPLYLKPSYVDI